MHLQALLTLAVVVAPATSSSPPSLYDLARRDCPVGSPGIPQYLRCVTECRVANEVEDEQRLCVGERCSHICKDPEQQPKQQNQEEKEKEKEKERDL
ncbi:hypothetical protein F4775DRAFT_606271 [Biscogniauxia sp. FL1348]|nr:hypothetical protein F4775DRAFT_606271 [Biscogniauxia sp. FL1348]